MLIIFSRSSLCLWVGIHSLFIYIEFAQSIWNWVTKQGRQVNFAFLLCSDVSVRPPTAVEGGVGGAEQWRCPETGRGPGLEHQQLQFYLSLCQSCQCSHPTAQPGQRTEPHPKERQVHLRAVCQNTTDINKLSCVTCSLSHTLATLFSGISLLAFSCSSIPKHVNTRHAHAAYHTSHWCKYPSVHLIGGVLGSVCSDTMLSTTCKCSIEKRMLNAGHVGIICSLWRHKFLVNMLTFWRCWFMYHTYESSGVPWLCWLLMVFSLSLRARLFEWISSFTKSDSGDDHVPFYPKGGQPPSSQWVAYTHTRVDKTMTERHTTGGRSSVSLALIQWPHFGGGWCGCASINQQSLYYLLKIMSYYHTTASELALVDTNRVALVC